MPDEVNCPDFEEATRRFGDFLVSENWPRQIMWIRAADIIRRPGHAITIVRQDHADNGGDAQQAYEAGRRRGLGVLLDAICTLGDATCAVVEYPADQREAELLMYPSSGGLKLSVATLRTEGVVRGSSC